MVTIAKITVNGFCDDIGSEAMNKTLSLKRAKTVKDYLISKGIPSIRFNAVGFGETKPVADNKTSAGRAKNRRVELRAEY